MKLARVLILALGLIMIAAIPSFAAVPFVTSSTLNQMAPNAETGLSGNVVLTALAPGTVLAGEIINVSYNPAVISSLSTMSMSTTVNGSGVVLTSFANAIYGVSVAVGGAGGNNINAIVGASNITLNFTANQAFLTGDEIQIIGVRLNVSGFATVGGQQVVTISSVLGSASLTNPTVPVALFVVPFTVTTAAPAAFTQIQPFAQTFAATVTIKEAGSFSNAFETQGLTYPTKLILQVTGLPVGMSVSGIGGITTDVGTLAVVDPLQTAALYAAGEIIIDITAQSANTIDNIAVPINLTVPANTTLALNPAAASVAVTLAPAAVGVPLYGVGPLVGPDLYAVSNVSAGIPITVTQLATALLSVFNSWILPMPNLPDSGFDTGIAITNTTGFGASAATYAGGPFIVPQTGTITVVMFPANSTTAPVSFTTGPTIFAGTGGLDANGNLPPHGTWTVLVSQLATQAGFKTGFTGQIYFFTNFSNAHGVSYISDNLFETQAQGYMMLVLPIGGTRVMTYENLNN